MQSNVPSNDDFHTHQEKLLMHEVQAFEDPECACSPEPRWLAFMQAMEDDSGVTEWESLNRPPSEEL